MAKKNLIEPVSSVLSNSPNEQWFNFHLEFGGLVNRKTPVLLGIEALYPIYEASVNMADVLLEQMKMSFLTGDLKTLDTQRDDSLNGLKSVVKGFLKSSAPEKRKAANKIDKLLKNYGNIAKMNYPAESAAIYNFVQDMEGKYSEEVTILELTGWVADLKRFNTQFTTLYSERDVEKTEKPDAKLVDVRKEVDANYGNLIKTIEVFMLTNPNHDLDDFVRLLNVTIKKYKTIYAQAKGRKNKEKPTTDE
jgi:hypothetical protein